MLTGEKQLHQMYLSIESKGYSAGVPTYGCKGFLKAFQEKFCLSIEGVQDLNLGAHSLVVCNNYDFGMNDLVQFGSKALRYLVCWLSLL